MNKFVFELSGYTMKTFSGFSKANIKIFGKENIPDGSIIFTANHFTRIETIFLPYHIHNLTHQKIFSLATAELFNIPVLKGFIDTLGATSTKDPNRDELILKTLLSGEAHWIIFPEGMMVKNKKLVKQDQFTLTEEGSAKRPHTGAAAHALRCEFYRERLKRLKKMGVPEYERLLSSFDINNVDDIEGILSRETSIVPVNITYYPASPKENILSRIASILMKEPSKRVMDELMTEGNMLFSNIDITIRFGEPIKMRQYLNNPYFESMLTVKRKIKFDEDISSKQISREICIQIMEKYMSLVYAMTCLNYDHILSCILKHFPYRKDGIDIYEFKCKVYDAITSLVSGRYCYLSDDLLLNQIHLLTDDRFKRFMDFLSLAETTGVIQIKDNKIIKDQTKFITPFDFHTIRMENPILVMANEVEPLKDVEEFLKKLAQKTKPEIMDMVKNSIIEKINSDFLKDYQEYYREGESKEKSIGSPIFLKQEKEDPGILLIHGYMAAPEEMKTFAYYLFKNGFTVYVPRLKGHGTSPEDLAGTKYEQWIESVEEGFVVLRHSCGKIIVGGFSTGAGLALDLCSRVDDIRAVFAVAPPMRLQDFGSYFVGAVDYWNTMIKKIHLNVIAKEFIDNTPENPHINYFRNPVAGIHQLEKFMDSIEPKLETIHNPALVVQSRKDPVVNPKGALKLFEGLGSETKEYYIFDYNRHGILIGEGVLRIYKSIENFIRQWI
ncbi:MAG: EstA protein [Desulfobacterales bacterium RIFOXYA12_FULL_46_15]|nr:MAG: EstA protein [Desulfobacterales bacterium RIFOXYA12_FULL_46_15]